MDIANLQPAGAGLGQTGVTHVQDIPGLDQPAASQRQLIQAVKAVNGAELFGPHSEMTFVFDRQTHRALVRILDRQTGEVIMQLPPERVLRMAEQKKGS